MIFQTHIFLEMIGFILLHEPEKQVNLIAAQECYQITQIGANQTISGDFSAEIQTFHIISSNSELVILKTSAICSGVTSLFSRNIQIVSIRPLSFPSFMYPSMSLPYPMPPSFVVLKYFISLLRTSDYTVTAPPSSLQFEVYKVRTRHNHGTLSR